MTAERTLLVLWDIDHTLLETGGVGRRVFAIAFEAVTGQAMRTMAAVSGRTEPAIFRETLALHGIKEKPDDFPAFAQAQARAYSQYRQQLQAQGRALPGAKAALQRIAELPGIHQTVLTGNTRESAKLKLEAFDLTTHLDLETGTYGTDADDRPALVAIARHRATQRYRTHFTADTTIIIGDTPNDVAAARSGGAHIIAVATGTHTTSELTKAGADTVLPNLTSVEPAVRGLTRL